MREDAATEAGFRFAPDARLLPAFATRIAGDLLAAIDDMAVEAPFRQMSTPGGRMMSAAMTNCGPFGWVSDRGGYRYLSNDPGTQRPWPALPSLFRTLAREAAAAAGFPDFGPDACLINRYAPAARMALHRDRDETDFTQPIVSVSLGLPATFLWGGDARGGRPLRLPLRHGDVMVWGGASRLAYHGVAPVPNGAHPVVGRFRFNLTFRRAV